MTRRKAAQPQQSEDQAPVEVEPEATEQEVTDGSITWVKPNDTEIVTNDNQTTIEYAESEGWTRK